MSYSDVSKLYGGGTVLHGCLWESYDVVVAIHMMQVRRDSNKEGGSIQCKDNVQ